MPLMTVTGFGVRYYLVCVDGTGAERTDDPDGINGRLSPRVTDALAEEPYTDVFLMSHGWMGDVPAAIRQYDNWIGAMLTCTDDIERAKNVRPGFKPLLVGFHWPSLPYGDEEMGAGSGVSFSTPGVGSAAAPDTATLTDAYADRIANTPAARKALETIFAAAAADTAPLELSPEVVGAYLALDREAGLGAGGPASGPGSDREPFDPEAAYQNALEDSEVSFGSFGLGPVLSLLQNLSFFKMKDRAAHSRRDEPPYAPCHPAGRREEKRTRRAVPPDGPQLRLHRRVSGARGTARKNDGGARALCVSGTRRRVVLVILRRHSSCEGEPRLLPLDRRRQTRERCAGHDAIGARHRRLQGVSAGGRRTRRRRIRARRVPEIRRAWRLRRARSRIGGGRSEDARLESALQLRARKNLQPREQPVHRGDAEPELGAHNDIAHPQVAHAMWSAVLL